MVCLFNCLTFWWLFVCCYILQNLVIRTKSVEFMPFYLSLSTFLMSSCFFLYGLFNYDPFIYVSFPQHIVCSSLSLSLYFLISLIPILYQFSFLYVGLCIFPRVNILFLYEFQVPNGMGTILGIVQLVLYFYYSNRSREDSREPLIVSYGWVAMMTGKGNDTDALFLLEWLGHCYYHVRWFYSLWYYCDGKPCSTLSLCGQERPFGVIKFTVQSNGCYAPLVPHTEANCFS